MVRITATRLLTACLKTNLKRYKPSYEVIV
jgi:hypothetical protein